MPYEFKSFYGGSHPFRAFCPNRILFREVIMKFIADDMLGRLARWLRILGYDTSYSKSISDNALIRRSHRERRLVLTRDTHLGDKMHSKKYVLIKSEKYLEQLIGFLKILIFRYLLLFSDFLKLL